MEKVSVKELIRLLEQELIRQGYKKPTLNSYRGIWKDIIKYFESCNEVSFSETIGMKYVIQKCDFFTKEKAGTLKAGDLYVFRTVRMMGDFQQHGVVLRCYHRSLSRINLESHKQYLNLFMEHCKNKEYATSTCKSYRRTAENLLCFLEAHEISIEEINAERIADFVKTLIGYSYKMVEFVINGVRAFLRFLHSEKHLCVDWSAALPSMKTRKQTRIPSIWNHDDILKMLNVIDRANPSGKRDYAMILMVARLGLRSIDVRRLTFENFNWEEKYIEFSQIKTKRMVRLPLLEDVGWAIIDYLKNGRPISDSPYLFLKHRAPIEPYPDNDSLHQTIKKYMRLAKLPIAEKKKVGMHSLRHTLATALLEKHTPIEQIADILGHQSRESTSVYLKSSLGLLRECALDPEVQ